VSGLLLREVKRARTAYDAEAHLPRACALRILELGLDVVAVIPALMGQDSAGVFPVATMPVADSMALPSCAILPSIGRYPGSPAVPRSQRKLLFWIIRLPRGELLEER